MMDNVQMCWAIGDELYHCATEKYIRPATEEEQYRSGREPGGAIEVYLFEEELEELGLLKKKEHVPFWVHSRSGSPGLSGHRITDGVLTRAIVNRKG